MGSATPLAGIRVLDLSTFLSGPSATRALADLGAEIVKIEPPAGDRTRAGTGLRPGDPPSEFWLALHRDRRSVVLDLKSDAGRDVLVELTTHADVLLENFRPGVTTQLRIAYEDLRDANPRLVYCTITGFGPDGPFADRTATDGPVQAFTGALELTGPPGSFGLPVPIQVADLVGGAYAAQAVVAALYARERTGRGTHADVSMAECLLGWLEITDRQRTLAPPTTLVLATADGESLLVQTTMHFADRFVELMAAVPGCELLATDPRFATRDDRREHLDAYVDVVQRGFRTRDADAWLAALSAVGIPAARIQTSAEARAHPQLAHRAATVETEVAGLGTRALLAGPFRFDGERRRDLVPPPALGQHTREVLEELLGCDDDRFAALGAAGAFGTADAG
ncbi:MAG TPA: CaiB/BaiF CoA-transferase family protein [Acidimicrobiia bacterium]|nr:CaiB/BaiF CoA-transferase family protein [Acidimicrobiia bacterium]